MPSLSDICDSVVADTGGFFAPDLVSRVAVETARDFCRYTKALNRYHTDLFMADDVDSEEGCSVIMAVQPFTDTEPCGIFGITVNGYKLAGIEREASTPSGAAVVSPGNGGIFYKFSTQTTCQIHPLPYGGDVRFFAAFMPVVGATQIEDLLWNSYGNGLMSGIKAKLLMMPGYQTSNPNAAIVFGNEYMAAKKAARADINRMVIGETICS